MTDTLFGSPRRRKGAAEALLDSTLRAWAAEGYLVGPTWGAARGVLRDAARAVDSARHDMQEGTASALAFSRTNENYRQALAAYRPGEEVPTHDAIDTLIANLTSSPPLCD